MLSENLLQTREKLMEWLCLLERERKRERERERETNSIYSIIMITVVYVSRHINILFCDK